MKWTRSDGINTQYLVYVRPTVGLIFNRDPPYDMTDHVHKSVTVTAVTAMATGKSLTGDQEREARRFARAIRRHAGHAV